MKLKSDKPDKLVKLDAYVLTCTSADGDGGCCLFEISFGIQFEINSIHAACFFFL
jgi:hypothetical protein